MLAFAPKFLGEVRLRLGQTEGVTTARVVDDAGKGIKGVKVWAEDYSTGKLILAPGFEYWVTDSDGLVTVTVPDSGALVQLSIDGFRQAPELNDKYQFMEAPSASLRKTVTTTPPPGPAPINFVVSRKKTPAAPPAPQKTPGEIYGPPMPEKGVETPRITKTTWIMGGLALAAIVGGAIYLFTQEA